MVFEQIKQRGHENVLFCQDKESGLRAVIAVHNTRLGPALGGCRRWFYESEDAALEDVLRLSEAMTYKAAAADLPMGGAKSIIWKHSKDEPSTEALARAMGRFVERLNGLYIAAEDVGVNTQFIDWMARETKHVMGGETVAKGGDPAPYTALGVISGMRGALKHLGKPTSLNGLTIAVQGVGALGHNVCRIAAAEGAKLIVADINKERVDRVVREFGATVADPDAIITEKCDILCPCALGQVIDANNVASLNCEIVAPGANNVLDDPDEDSAMLFGRGVIYCPDFVNNGGGLLQLAGLWCGFSEQELDRRIRNIENVIASILDEARGLGSAHAAAMSYARKRLDAGKPLRVQTTGKNLNPTASGRA
ncbi:MAG: Glu/Leu/Phe/Val dehydrogenase dimerization domain-containing protein [Planctomycetota bacterium]|nr:Glu/Leu/Phe/Val dehydrogenase dimerization domain-containing protein [Planctomycetota bacterium]